MALDLAPYFEDRDGDPLAYTAVSSDPGVASVSVAGSALTLTPVGYGPASIEVTARDPGGLSAAQTFAVNASDRMVRAVLDETLAAMARAHLASARMTLGRRVGPGGDADERSRLTVGGRSIPLDRDAARQAAGRLLEGWAVSRLWRGGGLVEAGREAERRLARLAANAANGRARGGPPGPADLAASLGLNGLGAPVGLGSARRRHGVPVRVGRRRTRRSGCGRRRALAVLGPRRSPDVRGRSGAGARLRGRPADGLGRARPRARRALARGRGGGEEQWRRRLARRDGRRAPRDLADGRASLPALVGRGHVGVDDGGRRPGIGRE